MLEVASTREASLAAVTGPYQTARCKLSYFHTIPAFDACWRLAGRICFALKLSPTFIERRPAVGYLTFKTLVVVYRTQSTCPLLAGLTTWLGALNCP